jgi:hypothetical protein
MTYDVRNANPVLGQEQKCGRVKLVNEITILLSKTLDLVPTSLNLTQECLGNPTIIQRS